MAGGLATRNWRIFRPVCAACRRRDLHATVRLTKEVPSAYEAARSTRRKAKQAQFKPVKNNSKGSEMERTRQFTFSIAEKTGYLKCDLETAERIMAELLRSKRVDGKRVQALAKDFEVEVIALTAIARLLIRQRSLELKETGSILLAGCAEAGEPVAVVGLCRIAVRRGELNTPHFQKFLPKLKDLAIKERSPAASIIYAAILERRGKIEEAVGLLENAVENDGEDNDGIDEQALDRTMRSSDESVMLISDAYIELGRLYLDFLGDEEMARRAYQKGAFFADDPEAYHGLSQFEVDLVGGGEPRLLEQWVEWQTKAAASGHPTAQLQLADFYGMTDEEARQQTTQAAFDIYQHAAKLSGETRFRPFIYLAKVFFYCWNMLRLKWDTRFPQRELLWQKGTKTAWAEEWYWLSLTAPPLRAKPYLNMVRSVHRNGRVEHAVEAVKLMLKEEVTSRLFSNRDFARLQKYLETADVQYLDGTKAEADEEKTSARKPRGSPIRRLT